MYGYPGYNMWPQYGASNSSMYASSVQGYMTTQSHQAMQLHQQYQGTSSKQTTSSAPVQGAPASTVKRGTALTTAQQHDPSKHRSSATLTSRPGTQPAQSSSTPMTRPFTQPAQSSARRVSEHGQVVASSSSTSTWTQSKPGTSSPTRMVATSSFSQHTQVLPNHRSPQPVSQVPQYQYTSNSRAQGGDKLSPTTQTQATPTKMAQGNHGGRRHWPLEFWVVRHGETIENHTRTIAGQNSSGLTPRGHEQAKLLAEKIRDIHFDCVYISDLERTKQTANAVLRAKGPNVLAYTDSRLREKAAGQYEGFKIGYIEYMTRLSGQAHREFRPPSGESWEDVAVRSRSFMREVLAKYLVCTDWNGRPYSAQVGRSTPVSARYNTANKNFTPVEPKKILIITHGGFISEFLSSAVGGVPNCAKNCSIFVLACARENPQSRAQFFLKTLNEVSHLEPLLQKGVELPGPETVTETDANPKSIDDDADDEKDGEQSAKSLARSWSPDTEKTKSVEPLSPLSSTGSVPKSASSQSFESESTPPEPTHTSTPPILVGRSVGSELSFTKDSNGGEAEQHLPMCMENIDRKVLEISMNSPLNSPMSSTAQHAINGVNSLPKSPEKNVSRPSPSIHHRMAT